MLAERKQGEFFCGGEVESVVGVQKRVREWMSSVCGCAGGSVFGCGSDCGFFI